MLWLIDYADGSSVVSCCGATVQLQYLNDVLERYYYQKWIFENIFMIFYFETYQNYILICMSFEWQNMDYRYIDENEYEQYEYEPYEY